MQLCRLILLLFIGWSGQNLRSHKLGSWAKEMEEKTSSLYHKPSTQGRKNHRALGCLYRALKFPDVQQALLDLHPPLSKIFLLA